MEKIIKRKKKIQGGSWIIWEFTHDLGNNIKVTWEALGLADGTRKSTMVAASNNKGRILLLEKYCAAHGKRELVLPGGKVDKGETLAQSAARELAEETGYYPGKLIPLGPFHILPGYLIGTTYGFIATNLLRKKVKGDEKEYLKVKWCSLPEVLKLIKKGKIRDARTVAIILYTDRFIFSRY